MSGELHPPVLATSQAEALLERFLYEQVIACIDLDELGHLEQSLALLAEDLDGLGPARARQLARAMLDRALARLPDDLRKYLRMNDALADALTGGCALGDAEACPAATGRSRDGGTGSGGAGNSGHGGGGGGGPRRSSRFKS